MQAATSLARQARAQHRHDLRALTYVVLDDANGGIVRNLSHEGIGVQAVAAPRAHQIVRVRFELRYPKLRVETPGEVMWATASGQCGIRFLDLPPRMIRHIDAWIFGSLLESIPQHSGWKDSIFVGAAGGPRLAEEDDGLIVSPAPQNVIQLRPRIPLQEGELDPSVMPSLDAAPAKDWLSQPLSARSLAWAVDLLITIAAFLVFSTIFLSVTHEFPRWPLSLMAALAVGVLVPGLYCAFCYAFGGSTFGTRLSRLVVDETKENEEAAVSDRFR